MCQSSGCCRYDHIVLHRINRGTVIFGGLHVIPICHLYWVGSDGDADFSAAMFGVTRSKITGCTTVQDGSGLCYYLTMGVWDCSIFNIMIYYVIFYGPKLSCGRVTVPATVFLFSEEICSVDVTS